MILNPPGMTVSSDQHLFSPNNTNAVLREKVMRIENDPQRENALIFYQILFINNSLRKCMEISLENYYVILRFFFVYMYFSITGVKKIIHYIKHLVI